MKTTLRKLSFAALAATTLSLPAAGEAQSMAGMAGMASMMGMPGMAGMAGMQGMAQAMLAQAELAQRAQMSRMAIADFMGTLKHELVSAMKAGGPVNAIGVCNEKAPAIAKTKQQQLGFEIGRVSLKNRNPDNAPDEWEALVLELFETLKKLGNAPGSLEYYDIVETDAGREFRYMKAIPTGKVCTKCHGTEISPKVAAKLKELYPGDKATGFKVGDIRGAFTIRQAL